MKIGSKVSIGKITCQWPHKVSIASGALIQDGVDFRIGMPFDNKNSIAIGANTFIGRCCEINSSSSVSIGANCLIASHTTIVDVAHVIYSPGKLLNTVTHAKPIIIGDDVWIGTHCAVLGGIRIGEGSVIAAGAVVSKNVPPYEVWGGVPAKFIRRRV